MKNFFITIVLLLLVAGGVWADPPIQDIQSKVGSIYNVAVSSTYGNNQLKQKLDTLSLVKAEYAEDMLEALRDSLEDANDLLQALTGANKFSVWSEPVEVVVNFSLAGWKTAAAHTLLTITGDVEFEISAHCSSNVASTSSDSLWIFLGESGATGYRMLSALAEDMDAGENLIPVNYSGRGWVWTAAGLSTNVGGILRGTSFMGKDIKFEISDHAFTGGIVIFHVRWRPLTTGGNVVAGTGA